MTSKKKTSKKQTTFWRWAVIALVVAGVACTLPYIRDWRMSSADHIEQGLLAYKQGDLKKAEHHLIMAADKRDAQASFILGSIFLEKKPREVYAPQAAQYFAESAQQGFVDAQYTLALLYDQGLGVPEDKHQALHWGLLAAAQGHVSAIYASAVWLERGYNQTPEPTIALTFYEQAAAKGHPNAMRSLISIYSNGENGIPRNKERAEFWIQKLHQIEQTQ